MLGSVIEHGMTISLSNCTKELSSLFGMRVISYRGSRAVSENSVCCDVILYMTMF